MSTITDSGPVAKYLQLKAALKGEIENGKYAVGERICTEAELIASFGVSTTTAIRALRELEQEGLVTRRRGKGTFLRSRQSCTTAAAPPVTLLLHGRSAFGAAMMVPHTSPNWFIGYEIHRGIINSYPGPVQLVSDQDFTSAARDLTSEGCCAIVIDPGEGVVDLLREQRIPYVAIDHARQFPRRTPNTVLCNRFSGVCEGMFYLINELGHRDIALIRLSSRPHPIRMAGYVAALEQSGIPYRPELVTHAAGSGAEEGGNAIQDLLAAGQKFTAVFADTDIKAMGAIEALRVAGLRVPDDVSVLGFDDIPGAAEQDPPLTTIHVPNYETGVEAVRMLEQRMATDGADVPERILDARLVIRKSCGPAPESKGR